MEWSGTFRQEKRIIFFVPYLTRPHILRHTFATRLCESGVNIKVIQDVLGHVDVSTTMDIYVDVMNETKKRELANFDGYMANARA